MRNSSSHKATESASRASPWRARSASTSLAIIGQSLSRWVFFAVTRSRSESTSIAPPSVSIVVRRSQSVSNPGRPRSVAMTSTRMPVAPGARQRKWTASPPSRCRRSNGGTAITSASRASRAAVRRSRFASSASTSTSVSRLNSAPPYNTHAWPPMRSERTPLFVRVERTLRIGLGVKGPSQFQIGLPELGGFLEALGRGQGVPLRPFRPDEIDPVDGVLFRDLFHDSPILPPSAAGPPTDRPRSAGGAGDDSLRRSLAAGKVRRWQPPRSPLIGSSVRRAWCYRIRMGRSAGRS